MDSMETLETLIAQVKRGDEEKDTNLVINSLESLSLLANKMRQTATSKKNEDMSSEIIENIRNFTVVKNATSLPKLSFKLSEPKLKALKAKLFNKEVQQDDVLESVGEIEDSVLEPKEVSFEKIDSNFLNQVLINISSTINSPALCKFTKEEMDLLRQEILIRKNTVRFKDLMSKARDNWAKFINSNSLSKPKEEQKPEISVPSKSVDLKNFIIDKAFLKGIVVNQKDAKTKSIFKEDSSVEIQKLRDKINGKVEEIKKSMMNSSLTNSSESLETVDATESLKREKDSILNKVVLFDEPVKSR